MLQLLLQLADPDRQSSQEIQVLYYASVRQCRDLDQDGDERERIRLG